MAIFLGNKEPEWPQLTYPTVSAGGGRQPMFPYFGFPSQTDNVLYLPGFSNDAAAGSCIKFTYDSYGRGVTRVDYLTKTGTALTPGKWGDGFTYADVTGAEGIAAYYMDEVDECLYMLAINTTTAPDQYKLISVDKEGLIDESNAWQSPSGNSFDIGALTTYWEYIGSLSRTGADQDGNFVFVHSLATIGQDIGTNPYYRGAVMTFAESDGALTESHLTDVDTAVVHEAIYYNSLAVGPTSNNIWFGNTWPAGVIESTQNPYGHGSIVNATTGLGHALAYHAAGNWGPRTWSDKRSCPFRWRGYYCMAVSGANFNGPQFYTVDSMHSFVDELAVKYGIL